MPRKLTAAELTEPEFQKSKDWLTYEQFEKLLTILNLNVFIKNYVTIHAVSADKIKRSMHRVFSGFYVKAQLMYTQMGVYGTTTWRQDVETFVFFLVMEMFRQPNEEWVDNVHRGMPMRRWKCEVKDILRGWFRDTFNNNVGRFITACKHQSKQRRNKNGSGIENQQRSGSDVVQGS